MSFYIFKILVTLLIIVFITELAKFNIKLASLFTAMPIITFLCLFWIYFEGAEKKEINEYVYETLKYLLPTIPMFIIFPYVLEKTNFYMAIFCSVLSILFSIFLLKYLMKFFLAK